MLLTENAVQAGILRLVGQDPDVINLIGYVTRFHVILCLMSRALPSFFCSLLLISLKTSVFIKMHLHKIHNQK